MTVINITNIGINTESAPLKLLNTHLRNMGMLVPKFDFLKNTFIRFIAELGEKISNTAMFGVFSMVKYLNFV